MAKVELSTDKEWLLGNAAADEGEAVSVGGMAHRLGMLEPPHLIESAAKTAFAKLIELRRREQGLSLEALAAKTSLDLADLVAIEEDPESTPSPAMVGRLAEVLDFPRERLLQLAGFSQTQDDDLERAAIRFAARSKPVENLSSQEREALAELVKVMGQ